VELTNSSSKCAADGRSGVKKWIIRPYRAEDNTVWKAFLQESNNGTLFHDLDFLAYHPPGKYDFRHVIASRGPKIEAVIPGALSADGLFVSTAGASVGGPAIKKSLPAEACLHLIEALQHYCRSEGWQGIEITLPPPVYHNEPNQIIEFVLQARGFQLVHRSMPLLIPLEIDQGDRYRRLFRQSQRSYVRACREKGIEVTETDLQGLAEFLDLFEGTYQRLETRPTHTREEIERLLHRLPDRVHIWSARLENTTIASVLLFVLNRNICVTFYICDRASHREFHGVTVLIAEVVEILAKRGFRYLDLGPSASTMHFNRGVVAFKESLGAQAFCRDRWRWESRAA
jgi:hypothetical protein